MFTINTQSSVPIFEQIVQQVGKMIAFDVLKPHDQLPTVRTLAKDLGINPNTVAKAYSECETAGLIYSVAGKGLFVTENCDGINSLKKSAYHHFKQVYRQLLELGEDKSTILRFIEDQEEHS